MFHKSGGFVDWFPIGALHRRYCLNKGSEIKFKINQGQGDIMQQHVVTAVGIVRPAFWHGYQSLSDTF